MKTGCIERSRIAALGLAVGLGMWLAGASPALGQDVPVPVPVPAGTAATPVPATSAPAAAQAAAAPTTNDPDRVYRVGEIVVGDRVQIDPTLQNYWRPGVVTEVKTMIGGDPNEVRGFVVRGDNGGVYDVMATPRSIKK
jgi:hypothetical protein